MSEKQLQFLVMKLLTADDEWKSEEDLNHAVACLERLPEDLRRGFFRRLHEGTWRLRIENHDLILILEKGRRFNVSRGHDL